MVAPSGIAGSRRAADRLSPGAGRLFGRTGSMGTAARLVTTAGRLTPGTFRPLRFRSARLAPGRLPAGGPATRGPGRVATGRTGRLAPPDGKLARADRTGLATGRTGGSPREDRAGFSTRPNGTTSRHAMTCGASGRCDSDRAASLPPGRPESSATKRTRAVRRTERPSSQVVSGDVLLSHAVARAVPSALRGLASGFGMGPGVSLSLWSPKLYGDMVRTAPAGAGPYLGNRTVDA